MNNGKWLLSVISITRKYLSSCRTTYMQLGFALPSILVALAAERIRYCHPWIYLGHLFFVTFSDFPTFFEDWTNAHMFNAQKGVLCLQRIDRKFKCVVLKKFNSIFQGPYQDWIYFNPLVFLDPAIFSLWHPLSALIRAGQWLQLQPSILRKF